MKTLTETAYGQSDPFAPTHWSVVLGAQDVSVTVTSQVRVKETETGVSGMAAYGSVSQGIALLLAVLALN